jgi:hypothetical protein
LPKKTAGDPVETKLHSKWLIEPPPCSLEKFMSCQSLRLSSSRSSFVQRNGHLPAGGVVLRDAVAGLGDDPVSLEVELSFPEEPVAELLSVPVVVWLVSKLVAGLLVAVKAGRSGLGMKVVIGEKDQALTAAECSLLPASMDQDIRLSTCSSPWGATICQSIACVAIASVVSGQTSG